MKSWFVVSLGLLLSVFALRSPAQAQDTAQGRAFGTILDLLGTTLDDQSDTGVQSAPNPTGTPGPNSFDKTKSGATVNIDPLAEVVTGPSRTRGCSNSSGCPELFSTPGPTPLNSTLQTKQFAFSEAGNATASALIGQAPKNQNVLDVVSSGSSALVACSPNAEPTVTAASHVDALVIAGNVVPIPGVQPPNTTIVSSQLPLIVLNEQFCPDPKALAGTTTCTVNAVHAQLASPIVAGVLDLKVSGSTASVTSPNCAGAGGGWGPNLGSSKKDSLILQSDRQTAKASQIPAPNDPIRFTVSAINSAATSPSCTADQQTGHHLKVIDRIPRGVTLDPTSITLQIDNNAPAPVAATDVSVGPCSADLQFVGCEPEPASDSSRQCLTVQAGDLAPQQTKKVSFIATVDSNSTGGSGTTPGCDSSGNGTGICNVALIQVDEESNPSGTPRKSAIICPIPSASGISGGDILQTTGSGGCSLGGGANGSKSDALPVLLVGALLAIRQLRRRNFHT